MTNVSRLSTLIPKAMLALCLTGWVSPVLAQNLPQNEAPVPSSNYWSFPSANEEARELVIVNPASVPQHIPGYGDFEAFQTQTFPVPADAGVIRARFPVQAWLQTAQGSVQNLTAHTNPWPLIAPRGVWFEVSNKDASESFLVRLEQPNLIAQAREQIRFPDKLMARRLMGVIKAGGAGFNRNLSDPLRRSWGWEVASVSRFADLSSIDCDGSPRQVEESLAWWLEFRRGQICFWNYKVVREIPR